MSRLILATCHLYILGAPTVTESQELAPLPIEEALRVRSFGQLVPIDFSPDGKWLAYTVQENQRSKSVGLEALQRTGVPSWAMGTDIWLSNTESGEAKNLTGGKGNNWLPVWSPNGRYLAFLSNRDGESHARLWIWDSTTGDLRRVSSTEVRAECIAWMPDSRALLVTSVPEGLSTEEYAQRTSTAHQEDASVVAKASGATVVLYHGGTARSEDKKIPTSDPWSLDRYLRDLVLVDIDGGKTRTLVHLRRIKHFRLAPDGSRLAYTVPKKFEKPGSQQSLFDLVTVNVATQQEQTLASDIRLEGATFSWSPDGTQLAFRWDGIEERRQDCYVVDVRDGTSRNVSSLFPTQPPAHYKPLDPPLWHPNRKYIYYIRDGALWRSTIGRSQGEQVAQVPAHRIVQVIAQLGNLMWTPDGGKSAIVLTHDDLSKQDGFYGIDLDSGASTKLVETGQCYTCLNVGDSTQFTAVTRNGQNVAYYAEDAQHHADLWVSDATFRNGRRTTHLNPHFDKYKMGSVQLVNWLGNEGERLQGALLLPPDFEEGKRYPLVVWVYRGASLSDRYNQFALGYSGPFNAQLLATRGYAVFAPDIPQHLGTAMADIANSVLPGIGKLVEMGVADPNRIGVIGQSFGGYSVLALIVQAKRFKAAIEIDGFGDLISGYGEMTKEGTAFLSSVLESQGMMGGPPWQFRDRYIDNSPLYYLDRVGTPLLIVHGAEDTTSAPFLGDQIFVGLRRLGKEVEYAKYEGEGHSPLYWSYANQLDVCSRVINWLDKHLNTPLAQERDPNAEFVWRPGHGAFLGNVERTPSAHN